MDGTIGRVIGLGSDIASPGAGVRGEAESAARKYYERWEAEMHATRGGDAFDMRVSSDPDAWCDEWFSDCAPADISDAELAVMRVLFCREAELLIETYDGPRLVD